MRKNVTADRDASSARASAAIIFIIGLGGALILGAAAVAWRLSRDLRREVGAAVGHIQSSSAELEAAAAQQATGGRDQASAMSEITTTISELLITSRQIAESAQRVSKVAEDTAEAARTGDATIDQTRASITAIRTQVDQIVQHMLALGEKSQQIGGVVDLVSELAEQTNILAINATIEASGAGEWGRRFAVVAEEIRKLADRTAGSAKEIRALIEDVRGAVNTTVMATEIGAKAVDAGSRQFDDATSSFRRIAAAGRHHQRRHPGDRAVHQAADHRGRAGQRRPPRTPPGPAGRPRPARCRPSRPRRTSPPSPATCWTWSARKHWAATADRRQARPQDIRCAISGSRRAS